MSHKSGQGSKISVEVSPHLLHGLSSLRQAHDYAQELQRDIWDFAVEIGHLKQIGLSNNDFRWMVCKGLVKHAQEVTKSNQNHRLFSDTGELIFTDKTCFVLTENGLAFIDEHNSSMTINDHATIGHNSSPLANQRNGSLVGQFPVNYQPAAVQHNGKHIRPVWNADLHELCLGELLVKRFKLPSRNQETILTAFEEEDWPPRIDDPLSLEPDLDPKRRLHDTIKSLNRHQKNKVLRFMGDGTGEGIRWKIITNDQVKG